MLIYNGFYHKATYNTRSETAMHNHSKQRLLFKDIGGKKVEADFLGGEVTSDAGLLLFREVDRKLRLTERIAPLLRERRDVRYTDHSMLDLLRQRVFQIVAGYEDADDADTLRNDPALKMACERTPDGPALASQPTFSRFENSVTRSDLYRFSAMLLDVFIESYRKPPKGIILDIDDTADETHGHQQLSLFNGYYDSFCYQPIHIYEGNGRLITTILRPGKRPTGREAVSILKRIVERLRQAWPEVGILVRADSHYGNGAVMDFCESQKINYILGLTPHRPLFQDARRWTEAAVRQARGGAVQLFGEFRYQAKSWTTSRRVIVKAEHTAKGPNTRFIVTNLEERNPIFLYKTAYCGRGEMELFIKGHKTHLHSDRTSCSRFSANAFRLLLTSLAYILVETFRRKHLHKTIWAKSQIDTIQKAIIKIGARVREIGRKIRVHLPTSYPWAEALTQVWESAFAT
jgi:hypothetical protein